MEPTEKDKVNANNEMINIGIGKASLSLNELINSKIFFCTPITRIIPLKNFISIQIPPLSERRDDIPLLSYYFLKKLSTIMNKEIREISPDVMSILTNYDFPGNVRELENIIERGLALANGDTIEVSHLPEDLMDLNIRTFRKSNGKISSLEDQEVAYIKWVLNEVGGNKGMAAEHLGIDRVSLWRKIKKYGLEKIDN